MNQNEIIKKLSEKVNYNINDLMIDDIGEKTIMFGLTGCFVNYSLKNYYTNEYYPSGSVFIAMS